MPNDDGHMTNVVDTAEATRHGAEKPEGSQRRRRIIVMLVAVVIAAVVFGLAYFQPYKLFVDDRVNQPLPTATTTAAVAAPATTATAPATATTPAPAAAVPSTAAPVATVAPAPPVTEPVATTVAGPITLAQGSFISREHPTRGTASILDVSGQQFVRFEDFSTSNGPKLVVYLTTAPPDAPDAAFDDDIVDLGDLQGNIGNQNYEIPAGVDLARYRTVVVWCARFHVAFGAAALR